MIQIPSEVKTKFDALLIQKAIPEKFFNAPRNKFRHFSPGPDLVKPDSAMVSQDW